MIKILYIDPIKNESEYYINPFMQTEVVLIDMFKAIIIDNYPNLANDELIQNETLIQNSIKIIKLHYKEKASLLKLQKLITNKVNGTKIVLKFLENNHNAEDIKIASWFLNDYFNKTDGIGNNCFGNIINMINNNSYLSEFLNPSDETTCLDLGELTNSKSIIINCDYGYLLSLGKTFSLIMSSLLHGELLDKGNEIKTYLYINSAQYFLNKNLVGILTSGRNNNISVIASIDSREQIMTCYANKEICDNFFSNTRNILMQNLSLTDCKYYAYLLDKNIKDMNCTNFYYHIIKNGYLQPIQLGQKYD